MSFFSMFGKRKVTLGLALGGGGAKGMAHVGAIKAFEELGVKFDIVAGTSIGSIVGGLYAMNATADEMYYLAKKVDFSKIKGSSALSILPTDSKKIETPLKEIFGERAAETLDKPFCAVAVDLVTGKEVDFTEGKMYKICCGSSAYVPFFKPVEYNDMHLVDGAFLNEVPCDVCKKMGADVVVGIDLSEFNKRGTSSLKTFDVILGVYGICASESGSRGKSFADFMFKPNLKDFTPLSTKSLDEMFEIGYAVVKDNFDEMKRILKRKGVTF